MFYVVKLLKSRNVFILLNKTFNVFSNTLNVHKSIQHIYVVLNNLKSLKIKIANINVGIGYIKKVIFLCVCVFISIEIILSVI